MGALHLVTPQFKPGSGVRNRVAIIADGPGTLWIDGLQLGSGAEPSPYGPRPGDGLEPSGPSAADIPARRALGRMDIDGDLSERAWQEAPAAEGFVRTSDGEPAEALTRARVLFDEEALASASSARGPRTHPRADAVRLRSRRGLHLRGVGRLGLPTLRPRRRGSPLCCPQPRDQLPLRGLRCGLRNESGVTAELQILRRTRRACGATRGYADQPGSLPGGIGSGHATPGPATPSTGPRSSSGSSASIPASWRNHAPPPVEIRPMRDARGLAIEGRVDLPAPAAPCPTSL